MGPRADQDARSEPAGGAHHSQGPGPGPESPGRCTQRADHGAAFHLREREPIEPIEKSGVYNKNDVIPSRFSGEGPCVLPWSFMELRNARSLGQSPRDDDLQFSHTLFSPWGKIAP